MLRSFSFAHALAGAASLGICSAAFGACTGPGAPTTTETKCLTAVQIPGNKVRSFDISWVNPHRAEYYLADRSNAGIQVIDTQTLKFKRTIGGFVGIKPGGNDNTTPVNNNISGPDGVTSHGRWLYAGDGDSTLKVIDLDAPNASAIKQSVPTGGKTRVDEMALTTDGELLLAANNAEDPPFATLFNANGDRSFSSVTIISRITADNTIIPAGAGLSMEQPAWEPKTKRFYVSIPQIANNPAGCTFDGSGGNPFCQGGLAVIDPTAVTPGTFTLHAFDATTNTGVLALSDCGPNGATVGPHSNIMLGCTPQNVPTNRTTQVINAVTKHFVEVGGLTGSDEVWFNSGDNRYYTASNRACGNPAGCNPPAGSRAPAGASLGVVDAKTNFLIEKIPASTNSHSVAADSKRDLIFVPQVAPNQGVPGGVQGGDSTDVGAGVCGSNNGCVAVYVHKVDRDRDDDHDHDRDDEHDRDDHGERHDH
jgi:hypothetical protein